MTKRELLAALAPFDDDENVMVAWDCNDTCADVFNVLRGYENPDNGPTACSRGSQGSTDGDRLSCRDNGWCGDVERLDWTPVVVLVVGFI